MRVLVVGGSGFIGSRLIDTLLERGHAVTNFDKVASARHAELTVTGNVCSVDELTAAGSGADAVIHLAAEHRDDVHPVSLYEEVNVGGARAVAQLAESAGIARIVFTSTVAVYGLDKDAPNEDATPDPFNEYGRTKLAAEHIFREWAAEDPARSLVIVRPSVVFGEGNRGNVYTLARQISSRKFVMVGSGANKKSMSYVGNIVEYLADSLDAPAGELITNFADKPDLTTRELIDLLRDSLNITNASHLRLPLPIGLLAGHVFDLAAKISGRNFPVSAIRIRKFASETTVNTDRLLGTGYRPRYSLKEALQRTVAAEFHSDTPSAPAGNDHHTS